MVRLIEMRVMGHLLFNMIYRQLELLECDHTVSNKKTKRG